MALSIWFFISSALKGEIRDNEIRQTREQSQNYFFQMANGMHSEKQLKQGKF